MHFMQCVPNIMHIICALACNVVARSPILQASLKFITSAIAPLQMKQVSSGVCDQPMGEDVVTW